VGFWSGFSDYQISGRQHHQQALDNEHHVPADCQKYQLLPALQAWYNLSLDDITLFCVAFFVAFDVALLLLLLMVVIVF
jgi:hypothetical protein